MTCCKGRDGAHYGWCAELGGPGHKPGSLEAAIAAARTARPRPAPPVSRNNGWHKPPPGLRRRIEINRALEEAPELHAAKEVERRVVTEGRPGPEITNPTVRRWTNAAIDQGWAYDCSRAGLPRLSRDGVKVVVDGACRHGKRSLESVRTLFRRKGIRL